MFVIKANSAEEMRDQIVKWLNFQSTIHSSNSRLAKMRTRQKNEALIGDAYASAALFLQHAIIETNS